MARCEMASKIQYYMVCDVFVHDEKTNPLGTRDYL